MDVISTVSTVTAVGGVIVAFLSWRHPKSPKTADTNKIKGWTEVDILARIEKNKMLRVAYLHYPPFCCQQSDEPKQADGLYASIVKAFCDSQGIQVQFEQVRFSSAIDFLLEDKADIVLPIFQTPQRSRKVDFTAFMHTVSVSGVTRKTENRLKSQSDMQQYPFVFVVCRGEIGHELLETSIKIPSNCVKIIDTSNIADIVAFVAEKKADIAIADSLSCQHALDGRGAEGPLLKPVLRRRPLYLCQTGVMIQLHQEALANWLDRGLKEVLKQPDFQAEENEILERYHGIISKI